MEKTRFQEIVKTILDDIGIPVRKRDKFLAGSVTLREIGICLPITDLIDDRIKEIDPDYDGCTPNDTFNEIWDWNYGDKIC